MKKVVLIIVIFSLFCPLFVKATSKLNLTKGATSAIMIEATTGKILYNDEANKISSVASLTKMMSLIIVFEFMEQGGMTYDEVLTVSKNAQDMGGTQLWLSQGDLITVKDLLKGVVMASANDAMYLLAERVAGTEENFVNMMNQKTKELGLKNTNFKNCVGFDEKDHYSTAYDMAIIAKNLISHEQIFTFSSVYEDYIYEDTDKKSWISNTNKLVRFYEGADGLKTGWTEEAGSCIAVTALKNNLRLIAITLGYSNTTLRNSEAMELLNYGFNQYKVNLLYKKGDIVTKTSLDKASDKTVNLVAKNDILVLQKKIDSEIKYQKEIKLTNVNYPIKKGDELGILYLKDGNKTISKTVLVAEKDINKINIFKLYLINLRNILTGN